MNTEIAVKQRVELVLKEKGLSVNLFAKGCGVSQQTLSDQFRGRCKLSYVTISAILEYFPDLSAEWLLRGEGDMLKPAEADTTPLPLAEDTQTLSTSNEEELERLQAELEQQKEFNALQKEYVADLKERIKEYQERVSELKDAIYEMKKATQSASVHHAKNA